MAKLKESECETILKAAGGVFGDKGFIGTDYITTPVRKPEDRELYMREHDYNNQVSSFRAPVERAVANLKTWRILLPTTEGRLERSHPRSGPQSASTTSKRVLHKPPYLEYYLLAVFDAGVRHDPVGMIVRSTWTQPL